MFNSLPIKIRTFLAIRKVKRLNSTPLLIWRKRKKERFVFTSFTETLLKLGMKDYIKKKIQSRAVNTIMFNWKYDEM